MKKRNYMYYIRLIFGSTCACISMFSAHYFYLQIAFISAILSIHSLNAWIVLDKLGEE